MKTSSPPYPALDLSLNLYRQFVCTLTGLLPPPLDGTPEALDARNHAAIAKVAALLPVDANEADLAAQCIAARGQAEDLLRLLRQNPDDTKLVMRLNAQYGSMVRTSLAMHGRLMRVQALRQKRESIDGATSRDAWARDKAELSMLKVAFPDAEPQPAASPEAARETPPEPVRAITPEAARAEPPAACADPTTPEHVSGHGTNSQDAAFETSLSEQPGNQGPKGSEETDLREFIGELLAKSRSDRRELAANGHKSPKAADQACHIAGETAPA